MGHLLSKQPGIKCMDCGYNKKKRIIDKIMAG